MKRNIYSSLALGSLLLLGSCASDEPLTNGHNDGKMSFTVSLPGQPGTRFAEGTTVDKLYYSVFDTAGALVMQSNQEWPKGSLTTTVTLQLVANQSYDIVFFADSKEAEGKGYTYDPVTTDFSVVYGQDMVNNDIFDAFVKNEKGVVADGTSKSVTLIRPFGQLNIGTDDLTNGAVEKYGLSNFSSTLSIAKDNVLSGINFWSEETTAQAEDLSFEITDFSALPKDAFPVSGYSYIEMNYLLVAPTKTEANLINATYTINGKAGSQAVNTLNLASTPVRQNYRTNIYGSLLTTQNSFKVTIDPAFAGELSYIQWDGSVTDPSIDEQTRIVTVSTPSQLAGFASLVNKGNQFDGYTVTLENDVDLANIPWTPIGAELGSAGGQSTSFKGVFDGQGHTIYNLMVSVTGESTPAGLFGVASYNPEIKNLNIDGFSISGNHYAGAVAGYSWGGAKISNCNVTNGTVMLMPNVSGDGFDNGDKGGAIAGYSSATVNDCHASNVKITGFRDLGALVGHNWGILSNCSASDIVITHSDENSYGNYAPYKMGVLTGFNGINNYNIGMVGADCTASNVTLNGLPTDNYVYIYNKQDLINFAASVNNKTETYEGKNVVMLADIDLSGSEWVPVGLMTPEDVGSGAGKVQGARFSGSFDGNGHAISNFVVNQKGSTAVAGVFGRVTGNVTIKNLVVSGANIQSDHYAAGIVAYIYNNNVAATSYVLTCAVVNSTIVSRTMMIEDGEYDNGDKLGGICGYVNVHTANAKAVFNNCRVSDCTLQAYRDFGGLIGYTANVNGSITGSSNAVFNLKLVQDFAHNYKGLSAGSRVGNVLGYYEGAEPNLMAGSSRNFGNTTTTINQ